MSTGSQNNISVYRSLTRGDSAYRRGSNASLHDGGSGWSGSGSSGDRGDLRSLSMFSRSKSSSASNLGPSSLQLGGWRGMVVMRLPTICLFSGMRGRGGRHDDDNCSEVSSTTSGYTSGRGWWHSISIVSHEYQYDICQYLVAYFLKFY